VYFQQGIVGWLAENYPRMFAPRAARYEAKPAIGSGLAPHPEGAE
jgi:hypothetical protein